MGGEARIDARAIAKRSDSVLTPTEITRDLVLVGGGHAHALVLRMLAMNPVPGARLTLISERNRS